MKPSVKSAAKKILIKYIIHMKIKEETILIVVNVYRISEMNSLGIVIVMTMIMVNLIYVFLAMINFQSRPLNLNKSSHKKPLTLSKQPYLL